MGTGDDAGEVAAMSYAEFWFNKGWEVAWEAQRAAVRTTPVTEQILDKITETIDDLEASAIEIYCRPKFHAMHALSIAKVDGPAQ